VHKTLIIVFVLAIIGGRSGAWAKDSPGQVQCKAGRSECENKCPKVESDASRECYQVCWGKYERCSKLDGRIDIRGTPAGAVLSGSVAIKPGAANAAGGSIAIQSGSIATAPGIATFGSKAANSAAAATTTTGAAPLSVSPKPFTSLSKGISGGAPVVQPGRSNLRVQ
jgi:hypothetical protein